MQVPEFDKTVMKYQSHKITLKIVPFSRKKEHPVPRLGPKFHLQLHVFVSGS